jgi:AraC-like DNA-binding protein
MYVCRVQVRQAPTAALSGRVASYCGFADRAPSPVRAREGPGSHVVVILTLEEHWLINGERRTSFAGGLHEAQVTTEHPGRTFGIHVDLDPLGARALFGLPLHELANRTVEVDDVLDEPFLTERLAESRDWAGRFKLLDEMFTRRLADARPSREIAWAWRALQATHGRAVIGALAEELGWSRKRIVSRFRDEIGLPPKAVAKLIRFERARRLAGTLPWAALAFECGYYDQSHLINDFRAITGRTPETFLQDPTAPAA